MGVAFANIFKGIPIDAEGIFHGSLFTLLNYYGIIGGLLFFVYFCTHGLIWLTFKTDGDLHDRCVGLAGKFWLVLLAFVLIFIGSTITFTGLLVNYFASPLLFIIPLLMVTGLVLEGIFIHRKAWNRAWYASAAFIFFATLFGVIGMYPALLPSSIDQAYSCTIYNTASSSLTLWIMLVVALIFVPLVIVYQAWVYKLFADKVSGNYSGYHEGL